MVWLLFTLIFGGQVHAAEQGTNESVSISETPAQAIYDSTFLPGHNLTPTSYVLKKGHSTLGTYAAGYGITDQITVATSPFIIGFYNMAMIDLRYAFYQSQTFQVTAEGMFFKSFDYDNLNDTGRYHQESTFLRLTASKKFSEFYTLHLSTGHQYFWESLHPYSLDPQPGQSNYVASVSILNELNFTSHFGTFLELGVLGLNYKASHSETTGANGDISSQWTAGPSLHMGCSFFYKADNWMLELGLSRSSVEAQTPNSQGGPQVQDLSQVHPETQLQFYL